MILCFELRNYVPLYLHLSNIVLILCRKCDVHFVIKRSGIYIPKWQRFLLKTKWVLCIIFHILSLRSIHYIGNNQINKEHTFCMYVCFLIFFVDLTRINTVSQFICILLWYKMAFKNVIYLRIIVIIDLKMRQIV